jgi:hypothetical protein
VNGRKKRTDHVAKENVLRATIHIRSILELDLQIPGATTGTAYKLLKVAEVDPLEVGDKFQRPNAVVMIVSHWKILPGIAPTESNDSLINSIQ